MALNSDTIDVVVGKFYINQIDEYDKYRRQIYIYATLWSQYNVWESNVYNGGVISFVKFL